MSCFNVHYYLRQTPKSNVDKVFLSFSIIAGFDALYACTFRLVIPELKFLDMGAPLGLLYGPLLHQLYNAAEKKVAIQKNLFFELIPFFLFFALYMILLNSTEIRNEYTATYLTYLYRAFALSWFTYPVIVLIKTSQRNLNNTQYKKYYLFTMLMLISASFEIPFVINFDFQNALEQQLNNSYFLLTILCIAVTLIQFHFINKLKEAKEIKTPAMERLLNLQSYSASNSNSIIQSQVNQKDLERVIAYLSTRPYLNVNFNILQMTKELRLSTPQLKQLFFQLFNQNITQTINNLRIDAVCLTLSDPNIKLSIDEIAFICGFNSRASFYRNFKKIKKCSPIEYRENKGNMNGIAIMDF